MYLFWFLVISSLELLDKASMNFLVHASLWRFVCAFLLDINLGAELHSHKVCVSSALVDCVQSFPKHLRPGYLFCTQQCIRSLVLYPCQHLVLSGFCILAFLDCLLAVLILISLKTNEVEYYFMFLLSGINSFVKYLLKSSPLPTAFFFSFLKTGILIYYRYGFFVWNVH